MACAVLADVGAQQQPPLVFRSGVDVVRIDVSVVDRTGQPVGNLAPGDFTVTVDGKPRTIVSAQFLKYEVRAAATTGQPVAQAPAPAPSTAPPAAPPPARTVLIAIDVDSMEPGDGQIAKRAAAGFLERLAPADRVGVVTIPTLSNDVALSTRRADTLKALAAVITGVAVDRYQYNIGLAEAFDIERGYGDVAQQVVARECRGAGVGCPEDVRMQVRQMQLQAHMRGQRSLDALAQLAEGLAAVEGPKTLVLVSGGLPTPDLHSPAAFDKIEATFAAAQISLYTLYVQRSSFGQVKDKPSPTALDDDLLEREGIENATSVAGGTLMRSVGTLDQFFERVATELSGSYLLGVEVAPADRDGRTHWVNVSVNRRGVEVRARRRYVIEVPRPARAEPEPTKGARGKAATETAPASDEAMTPEVEAAVERAGSYAAAYETALSGLVAEERYVQRSLTYQGQTLTYSAPARRGQSQSTIREQPEWVLEQERKLKSDFLLVKAQGEDRWMPFRDVFEVDGKAVREREERLQDLFLKAPATAAERAARINAESARYNIGFVERNINLPTLAMRLLDPGHRTQLTFRRMGEATISGVRTWEVAFTERGSPTIVRDADKDMPATGSFWIDPSTGRVVRSTMRLKVEGGFDRGDRHLQARHEVGRDVGAGGDARAVRGRVAPAGVRRDLHEHPPLPGDHRRSAEGPLREVVR